MPQACATCPLRIRDCFIPMTPEEIRYMETFKTGEMTVSPGATLLMEGSNSPQLFTVLSGMGTRYKTLEDGNRQVINFLFPGDFIGMQAGIMGEMKHSVDATTPMVLCVFNRSDIWNMFKAHPERAFDLTWIGAVEEHFLGETIATLGQRDASARLAWALLRIHQRLFAVGMARSGAVPLMVRQQDLADALGLSLVHTNKTLARLRAARLVSWTGGKLEILDHRRMFELAGLSDEAIERRPIM